MLRYRIVVLLVLIGWASLLYAQNTRATQEDVVFLKNGWVLHGLIVERVPGSHLVIEMAGENRLKVAEEEIEKMGQKEPSDYFIFKYIRTAQKGPKGSLTGRQPGFAFQWGLTFTPSSDRWGTLVLFPGLNLKAMYHLPQGWSLGGGLAVTPYAQGGTIPFFGEVQKQLGRTDRVGVPYLFSQLGYGYGAWENWNTEDFSGGAMGQAGFGYMLQTRRRTEWLFSLGVSFQQASFREAEWDWPVPPSELPLEQRLLSTVQLNIGMSL